MDEAFFTVIVGFAASVIVLFVIGLRRGKITQQTNMRIADNQQKQIALHERQVDALERMATALEERRQDRSPGAVAVPNKAGTPSILSEFFARSPQLGRDELSLSRQPSHYWGRVFH